jgi:hypothetical protein
LTAAGGHRTMIAERLTVLPSGATGTLYLNGFHHIPETD